MCALLCTLCTTEHYQHTHCCSPVCRVELVSELQTGFWAWDRDRQTEKNATLRSDQIYWSVSLENTYDQSSSYMHSQEEHWMAVWKVSEVVTIGHNWKCGIDTVLSIWKERAGRVSPFCKVFTPGLRVGAEHRIWWWHNGHIFPWYVAQSSRMNSSFLEYIYSFIIIALVTFPEF